VWMTAERQQRGLERRGGCAELDANNIMDCDGVVRKCADARWRTISGIDTSYKTKFGPSANDIKWGKKIQDARPGLHTSPLSFKLDPYGAKMGDSFVNLKGSTNMQVFSKPRGERWTSSKKFLRDYTTCGSVWSNRMRGDTQEADHASIRYTMSENSLVPKAKMF